MNFNPKMLRRSRSIPNLDTKNTKILNNDRFALIMFVTLFVAVPEVALRDFLFGNVTYQNFLLISYVLIFATFTKQLIGQDLILPKLALNSWLIYGFFLMVSFLFNKTIVMNLLLQPTFIFVLIILFLNADLKRLRKGLFYFVLLICVSSITSTVAHFILPFSVIKRDVFSDIAGHNLHTVFLSFSSSIWTLGGLTIPRLSGVFDEPGTYGFFISVFGSALYLNKRIKLSIFVFLCGVTTFSTAYFLFLLLIAPIILLKNIKKSVIFIIVLVGLILLIILFVPAVFDFIRFRVNYAFSGSHNRTEGWSVSLKAILDNPLHGGLLSGYKTRLIRASGISVFMAYLGIPAVISLLSLIVGGLFLQLKKLGYDVNNKLAMWPLLASFLITIINRNNLFNFGGYILALFAIIAGAGAPEENIFITKIKKKLKKSFF